MENRHTDTQIAFHLWSDFAAFDGESVVTGDGTVGIEVEEAIVTYGKQNGAAVAAAKDDI